MVVAATQTYADVKVGEKDNGWSVCEERYLTTYVEAHEAGIDVGRNLVDDGALRQDGSATPISDDRACSEAEQFDLALNPPAPEPVATPETTTAVTPTSTYSTSGSCGGTTPYAGGGSCWAIPYDIVACESGGDFGAYNPSGAGGAYQMMPEHGCDMSVQGQHECAAALWAGGAGRSNWVC